MDSSDLFDLDAQLNPTQSEVRASVRAFVDKRFAPIVAGHYEAGTFPFELAEELGELGVFGANITGYGCAGLDNVSYGLICQELERGDSGLRSFVSVQGALAMYAIHEYGSEAQRVQWLPPMARGQAFGCFGLTEHDAGSDPVAMKTRARRDGDDWILDGVKMWITNGNVSKVAVVWAGTDLEARSPARAIRGFLVPLDLPGVTVREIKGKLSLRASITSELVFDGVRLPASAMLPGTERGLGCALDCLNQARYGIAWGAVGAGTACYEAALGYQKERHAFGKPLAGFQMSQAKLVEMLTDLTNSQLQALRLGQLKDRGTLTPVQVSFAKRHNVRAARDIARTAREMLGANGIMGDYPVMRHMANLETVYTYEGTHEVHTLVVGRAITGLSAFD